jgi:hypothetical protein
MHPNIDVSGDEGARAWPSKQIIPQLADDLFGQLGLPLSIPKQTLDLGTSAMRSKADLWAPPWYVCFVPIVLQNDFARPSQQH